MLTIILITFFNWRMIICVCKAVSDKHIRKAVQAGEVLTLRDLTREFKVGTCCGRCVPAARDVLREAMSTRGPAVSAPLPAIGLAACAQRA